MISNQHLYSQLIYYCKDNFWKVTFSELFSLGKSLREVLYHNEVVKQEDKKTWDPENRSQIQRGERSTQEAGQVRYWDDNRNSLEPSSVRQELFWRLPQWSPPEEDNEWTLDKHEYNERNFELI